MSIWIMVGVSACHVAPRGKPGLKPKTGRWYWGASAGDIFLPSLAIIFPAKAQRRKVLNP